MIAPRLLAIAALAVAPAFAADFPTLPTLAADPQVPPPWWHGLTVGADATFAAAKGVRGMAGGDGFIGYRHEFSNNLVLGVQASAGSAPLFVQNGRFVGADFIGASAKLGYDMGRLTPYVTTSVDFARTSLFDHGFTGGTDAINAFLNGPGDKLTYGSVGAGFDYAITNNLTVGLGVSVGGVRGN